MIAVLCPGQGSQTPGMLNPWLELPGVSDQLAALSEAAQLDLTGHGTTSDADTIRDTAVAQPLIVATSLLALRALLDGRSAPEIVDVTAGHSVGEFSAAAVAGVFTDADAVGLVTERARLMAQAATLTPTAMSAVLGGETDEVFAAIEAAGCYPANINGGGQIVAAGTPEALAALADQPPAKARVIALQVAGAFHTPFMQSARDEFAPVAANWPTQQPKLPLLSNADGAPYTATGTAHGAATDVVVRLAGQIIAPVRWDLCQNTLANLGVTGIIELAPGGVLTGLARRALRGVASVAIKSPDDIPAARELLLEHSQVAGGQPTPSQESLA